jgi:hypothetical protein
MVNIFTSFYNRVRKRLKARVTVARVKRRSVRRERLRMGFVHEKLKVFRSLDHTSYVSRYRPPPVKDIYWTMMVPCMPAPWWGSQ